MVPPTLNTDMRERIRTEREPSTMTDDTQQELELGDDSFWNEVTAVVNELQELLDDRKRQLHLSSDSVAQVNGERSVDRENDDSSQSSEDPGTSQTDRLTPFESPCDKKTTIFRVLAQARRLTEQYFPEDYSQLLQDAGFNPLRKGSQDSTQDHAQHQDIADGDSAVVGGSAAPSLTCTLKDLSENMATTLSKICYESSLVQQHGIVLVDVSDFSPGEVKLQIGAEPEFKPRTQLVSGMCRSYVKFDSSRSLDGEYVYVESSVQSDSAEVDPPQYPRVEPKAPIPTHTLPEMKELFKQGYEKAAKSSRTHCYPIGPIGLLPEYEPLLNAGPYMKEVLVKPASGVDSSHIYASCSETPTASAMRTEDCDFQSANLLLYGQPQVWLSIDQSSKEKFEIMLSNLHSDDESLQNSRCSQWVRDLSILVPPALLDEYKIEYHIRICHPGQLIFTTPGAYHQMINLGPNCAESINFITERFPGVPTGYQLCTQKGCPLSPRKIPNKSYITRKKRLLSGGGNTTSFTAAYRPRSGGSNGFSSLGKRQDRDGEGGGKKGKAKRGKSSEQPQLIDQAELAENGVGIGQHLFPHAVGGSPTAMLLSVISVSALNRLLDMIRTSGESPAFVQPMAQAAQTRQPEDGKEYWEQQQVLDRYEESSIQYKLSVRLIEYHQARFLDSLTHATQLPTVEYEKLLGARNIQKPSDDAGDDAKAAYDKEKSALTKKISKKRKWTKWCGELGPGLLLLLPVAHDETYQIHPSSFGRTTDSDIQDFQELTKLPDVHGILERLCQPANAIAGFTQRNFAWKHELHENLKVPDPINGPLSQQELSSILESIQPEYFPARNVVPASNESSQDPTLVGGPEYGSCQALCEQETCKCVASSFKTQLLRIKRDEQGQKRLWVCSGSTEQPGIRKGEKIGEVTGEIHIRPEDNPVDECKRRVWYTESGEEAYHVHCKEQSSLVSFASHSCKHATAKLEVKQVGCRWRAYLEAAEDLKCGDEVRVNYHAAPGSWDLNMEQCFDCKGPCNLMLGGDKDSGMQYT